MKRNEEVEKERWREWKRKERSKQARRERTCLGNVSELIRGQKH